MATTWLSYDSQRNYCNPNICTYCTTRLPLLYRYSIIAGNNEHKFRIDPVLGHVIVNAPIDYEHTSSFQLQIEARDSPKNPGNQRRSLCHVNVAIIDVNDNRPVFGDLTYYAKVKETASVGSDVIRVQATDRDSGMFRLVTLIVILDIKSMMTTRDGVYKCCDDVMAMTSC